MSTRLAPPDRTHRLDLGRGRHLGWSEWGAANGIPVLFCSGAAMGSSLGVGPDAVAELGLRLLSIDRPGLGSSDPDPGKSIESCAADVKAMLDAQGIVRPPVLGFSQGAPFAVALAGANLVSAVAIVAGQDELTHPATRRLLHPAVARLVEAIEADSGAFETDFASRVDAAGMWSLVIGMSAAKDRALYESPEFAAAYRKSLEEGFAQGPGGYVRDLVLAMRPWPTRPEEVTVPVSLWYGALDTSPVHSPDFGVTLSGRFPNATLHTFGDEGGSLLWTRSREILLALLEDARERSGR